MSLIIVMKLKNHTNFLHQKRNSGMVFSYVKFFFIHLMLCLSSIIV